MSRWLRVNSKCQDEWTSTRNVKMINLTRKCGWSWLEVSRMVVVDWRLENCRETIERSIEEIVVEEFWCRVWEKKRRWNRERTWDGVLLKSIFIKRVSDSLAIVVNGRGWGRIDAIVNDNRNSLSIDIKISIHSIHFTTSELQKKFQDFWGAHHEGCIKKILCRHWMFW